MARKTHDDRLVAAFQESWNELGHEKRRLKRWLCGLPNNRAPNEQEIADWSTFVRSDQFSFWFPQLRHMGKPAPPNRSSLSTVLISDLSLWRSSFENCYHKSCDDKHFITDTNLAFLQMVIDTLMKTLLKLGEGCCSKS